MRIDEYAAQDGLGLAAMIRRGDISAAEATAAAREAIARTNPALNFLVAEIADGALAETHSDDGPAPYMGVPLLIKDVGAGIAGTPQELGSRLAQGMIPTEDSELSKRLRMAGFRIIGRSSTPELGSAFTTEPVAGGPTLNPWDLGRSAGGSSGGAAAAVSSGALAIAHAGDSAGSIRIPAHCCGVVGMKPTRARNPAGPQSGEVNSGLTTSHVLSRTVRDSAAALDATAGPDIGAPYWAPPPRGSFLEAASRPPPKLRIAVCVTSPLGETIADEIQQAALAAAGLCQAMGHEVEEASPQFDAGELLDHLEILWSANILHAVRKLERGLARRATADNLEGATWAMVRRGAALSADDLLGSFDGMNRFSRQMGEFFQRYDVLICPTFATTAPLIGALDGASAVSDLTDYLRRLFAMGPFTVQFNVTGQPAISLPLHQSPAGLPIGTQFVSRYADEETLFSLAGALEISAPWRGRRPPLSVFA